MSSSLRRIGFMEVALVLLPPLVHAYTRRNGFAQLGLIVVVFVGVLVVGVALPGDDAHLCNFLPRVSIMRGKPRS